MPDYRDQVDALASLMEEFGLTEATLTAEGFNVAFRRTLKKPSAVGASEAQEDQASQYPTVLQPTLFAEPSKPKGTPVASPMNGIFYISPSPSAPPFVRVGDTVTAGQVVGLIEAMKVFNEIPSPASGNVLEIVAESGSIVQPGDVLLYIG